MRDTIKAWLEHHGPICPGFNCAPHMSYDLTADHLVPGTPGSPLAVLCRRCNGRRGAKTQAERARA
jgi:5-methylcytosine-specific restriction endonuclease McrA